ncbi:MAG TPA: type II secretion system GspH family protein [Bacilli bacterium]|nr:type II secretion system GspH family protein [Bacilli bacterium]
MKLNKKGVTLVELVVSISLISIVLVFLLRLLIQLREMDDKSLKMLEYQEKTSLIIKYVQDEIKDYNDCTFKLSNSLTIECSNEDVNMILSKSSNIISIKNDAETKKYIFPDDAKIGEIVTKKEEDKWSIYKIDVTDDKDNIYPIEITYYRK